MTPTLKINEIFFSIQGESLKVGLPTIFIRLTGCPLRCHWCDTAYAFHDGKVMTFDEILERVSRYTNGRHITVTGGEPLAQKNCLPLLKLLCDGGYRVSLETSGALSLAGVDQRVMKVVDIKAPGSGEMHSRHTDIMTHIQLGDQLKFVLRDRADYDWACQFIKQQKLEGCCELLFAPVWEKLPAKRLAEWILNDAAPVRMQLQIHKFLWGEVPGH